MERRSSRGRPVTGRTRTPVVPTVTSGRRGGAGGSKSEPPPPPREPSPPPPEIDVVVSGNDVPASEEVVLNRRGMPARQRKRNRFYFDDDMVTPETWKTAIAKNAKKVKAEPVDTEDEDAEEILGDIPGIPNSTVVSRQNSRGKSAVATSPARSGGTSPVKQLPVKKGKQPEVTPEKVTKKGGRPVANTNANHRSTPVLSLPVLIPATPEKPARGNKVVKIPPPPPVVIPPRQSTSGRVITPSIKIDPDAVPPPRPIKTKGLEPDRWSKMADQATKIRKNEDEKERKKNAGQGNKKSMNFNQSNSEREREKPKDVYEKKTPKKDNDYKQMEKERQRSQQEKEKKQAILKEKEQERIAKEKEKERSVVKEKEKKALHKEKKRERTLSGKDHREPIAVLPPVVKLGPRTPFITPEEQQQQQQQHHHQAQQSPHNHQQLMAVIKIDDTSSQVIDKRVAHDISIRLRNLLKLPKAHKWVCYEWFYSNIDKVLFEGENDFQICLKESFPTLKARKLTRTEWTKIRRLMGKPRRCSQAFFDEEREELSRRRMKIRQIQQRKVTDFNYKELPDEIPLQLVIGTKVTARLRRPQDGLFTGTIEGVDTSNNTYRITFDRPGLGTHSIPDYEVLSNDAPETVSTSSFALKIPRRSGGFTVGTFKFQNPALLGDQPEGFPKSPFPADGMLGGFPIRLLDMIVRLSKLLKAKREKIMTLKELNVEAEKMKSYGRTYNAEYRTRYARCVLDLDSMNKEMAMYLEGIQTYCLEITNDHGNTSQMVIPEHILESSRQEASMVVSTYNCKANRTLVHNQKIVALVHHLTSLILQVRALSTADRNLYELKSLKDTIKEVKASLEGKNLQCFQNKIEIPMNRIIAGLCVTQPKAY
ncbi:unnamed protein product [Orchesella dallaii]|uniref:DIRP domain-containing protein n=1 Tax=Orchesella dallaii TaxID=48710 RepID=A0ABP1PXA1_9HEXA